MRFRLLYRGPLGSNGSLKQKQDLRRVFHPQLARLWQQEPLIGYPKYLTPASEINDTSLLKTVGAFTFASLVATPLRFLAELDILLFRPSEPGCLVGHGGDLDNRLKTLLDALRVPGPQEIPKDDGPTATETPFHCLLEDDALVSRLTVETERWLEDVSPDHVALVIHVVTRPTVVTWGNVSLSG